MVQEKKRSFFLKKTLYSNWKVRRTVPTYLLISVPSILTLRYLYYYVQILSVNRKATLLLTEKLEPNKAISERTSTLHLFLGFHRKKLVTNLRKSLQYVVNSIFNVVLQVGWKKNGWILEIHIQSSKKSEGVWILRVVILLLVEQLQLNGPCDKSSGTGCIGPSLPRSPCSVPGSTAQSCWWNHSNPIWTISQKGGPLPNITWVITPITRVITPVT